MWHEIAIVWFEWVLAQVVLLGFHIQVEILRYKLWPPWLCVIHVLLTAVSASPVAAHRPCRLLLRLVVGREKRTISWSEVISFIFLVLLIHFVHYDELLQVLKTIFLSKEIPFLYFIIWELRLQLYEILDAVCLLRHLQYLFKSANVESLNLQLLQL